MDSTKAGTPLPPEVPVEEDDDWARTHSGSNDVVATTCGTHKRANSQSKKSEQQAMSRNQVQ